MSKQAAQFQSAVGTLASPKASPKEKVAAAKVVAKFHAEYGVPFQGKGSFIRSTGLEVATHKARKPNMPSPVSTVAVPVARGTTVASVGPRMSSVGGRMRVVHRELCHSVRASSAAFQLTNFEINPGLNEVFPWLSGLATNFDQYKLVSMAFEYVPTCSTSEAGAVYCSWDPDPTDASPVSKSQMANSSYAISSNVWKAFALRLPSSDVKFTRSGSTDQSLTLYDHGQFFIATEGTGTNALGDLYVTYVVELIRPHVFSSNVSAYWHQLVRATGAISKASPFGSGFQYRGRRIFDPEKTTYDTNKVTFYIAECPSFENAGVRNWQFYLVLSITGTAVTASFSHSGAPTVSNLINITNAGATEYVICRSYLWTSDPTGNTITIDFTGLTTLTQCTVDVTTIDSATFLLT